MCIILLDKVGGSVTEAQIRNMFTRNGDGLGIIPLTGRKREAFKVGNPQSVDEVLEVWSRFKDEPYAAHLRLKTHGEIDEANCHPYPLWDDNHWLFHNGVLGVVPEIDKKMSDTWHLAEYFLKPIGKKLFQLLEDEQFRFSLGKMIGPTNKLVFVSPLAVHIINEQAGTWRNENNLWLSNLLAVDTPHYGYQNNYYQGNNYYDSTAATNKPKTVITGVVTPPFHQTNTYNRQSLAKMSLDEIVASLRIAHRYFLPAVKNILDLEVPPPASLEDVRKKGVQIYCEAAKQLHGKA